MVTRSQHGQFNACTTHSPLHFLSSSHPWNTKAWDIRYSQRSMGDFCYLPGHILYMTRGITFFFFPSTPWKAFSQEKSKQKAKKRQTCRSVPSVVYSPPNHVVEFARTHGYRVSKSRKLGKRVLFCHFSSGGKTQEKQSQRSHRCYINLAWVGVTCRKQPTKYVHSYMEMRRKRYTLCGFPHQLPS